MAWREGKAYLCERVFLVVIVLSLQVTEISYVAEGLCKMCVPIGIYSTAAYSAATSA